MKHQTLKLYYLTFLLLVGFALFAHQSHAQQAKSNWKPDIPKTWVDAEMEELEVPLANPIASPKHISAADYYRIPEIKIYKGYPVYAPGKEPPGYLEWLKKQEPRIAFDASKLKTAADWIKAGELVFHAPLGPDVVTPDHHSRNPKWYEKSGTLLTKDGRYPYAEYIVREKGKVEYGGFSCALCHTRVMPDGTVLKGAQGNIADDREEAWLLEQDANVDMADVRNSLRRFYAAPWVKPDPQANLALLSAADIIGFGYAIPPGVISRQGTALNLPARVPDLIGIKERKYLDATGLQLHRGAVDLMRYAALNQGMDQLASFNGFIPRGKD